MKRWQTSSASGDNIPSASRRTTSPVEPRSIVPFPGQPTAFRIDAHQWVQNVLEQWQLAAAVPLVVALPSGTATDEHRTIVDRLATAKRLLTATKPEDVYAHLIERVIDNYRTFGTPP
jgi:hypothetical protein